MPTFVVFTEKYIPAALALWGATEHIGLSPADEPEALVRFLRRNPGFSFVAVESGHLVGAVLCGHDGRRGYIYHLAVSSAHRKSGIGSSLLKKCLERLSGEKIMKCHAFVFDNNPNGELFWGSVGWVRRDELLVYSRATPPGA